MLKLTKRDRAKFIMIFKGKLYSSKRNQNKAKNWFWDEKEEKLWNSVTKDQTSSSH
jgi:hypothetical protein